MTLRVPACAALLAAAAAGPASAQPIAPRPPASAQPAFSPYLNMLGPWGFGYGYWGLAQPQMQLMEQQFQLQQQIQMTSQNLANFQNGINMGLVNPYLPLTGRGATFNNLGHWYPSARGGYGGGGGAYGGLRMLPRTGLGVSTYGGLYSGYGSAYGGMYGGGGLVAPIRR